MEQRATVEPTRLDVLCGSGHFVLTHPGNVRLRRIIGENFNAYLSAASKPDKSDIVDAIVQEVVHCNGRRSRVLKKDPIFSSWFAVSKNTKKVLRDKITSSLRVMSKSHEEDEATITLHNPDQRQEECSDCKFWWLVVLLHLDPELTPSDSNFLSKSQPSPPQFRLKVKALLLLAVNTTQSSRLPLIV